MSKFLLHLYKKIFIRKFFRKLNSGLFQLSLRGLGILNYENDHLSGEKHLLEKLLPGKIKSDNPILFDVGANNGNYSISLLTYFPNANIYAFEPHPASYSNLNSRITSSNIKKYNIALGETSGILTLYDRADITGSEHASVHKSVISELHKQEVVEFEVNVESIDNFAIKEGITYIDFLKIDTEGNELSVLRGASTFLKNKLIGCIQFEFNEMNIVSRVFFRDFRNILTNYELYRLLPGGLLHLGDSPLETEIFAYQNIVAFPKIN